MSVNKIGESQFLLAFVSLVLMISCSSYNATTSDAKKDDGRYSYVFHNNDYNINFHSYGGKHLGKRLFYRKYGELVFMYYDRLRPNRKEKGNNVYYSLFIVKKIPEKIIQTNDTITTRLYNISVLCFSENYKKGRKNIFKRYFTVGSKNYLFIGEYNRFYKHKYEIYQYHMTQEIEGLEL